MTLDFLFTKSAVEMKQTFKLKEGQPFIQLNKLLQVLQLAQTGGHAKILIQNEEVAVNGTIETQIRKKLMVNDQVQFEDLIITIENY